MALACLNMDQALACQAMRLRESHHTVMETMSRWRNDVRDMYKCAISEQLDVVLLADICHTVEGACVNE